jgi:hypothetical protein
MRFQGGGPNLYTHVANDPVNLTDATGRSTAGWLIGIGLEVFGFVAWEGLATAGVLATLGATATFGVGLLVFGPGVAWLAFEAYQVYLEHRRPIECHFSTMNQNGGGETVPMYPNPGSGDGSGRG